MRAKTTVNKKGFDNLLAALEQAKNKQVLVGIPQDKAPRVPTPEDPFPEINNAELAYIHEHGSVVAHIPPRPFLEPSILANKSQIATLQASVIQKALIDPSSLDSGFNKIGLLAQKNAQLWFTDPRNNWPPNAPSTIAAKLKKGSTDPKPLIDTGALRASISYVVRTK
jgi:hypothetical protein